MRHRLREEKEFSSRCFDELMYWKRRCEEAELQRDFIVALFNAVTRFLGRGDGK